MLSGFGFTTSKLIGVKTYPGFILIPSIHMQFLIILAHCVQIKFFSVADLNAIQWLSINQNPGISADNLNAIMAKLVNLERLSLNSNNLWKLNSDTFTFNAKLKSVSLHNNAISCLDGVFDNLIDNVSTCISRLYEYLTHINKEIIRTL